MKYVRTAIFCESEFCSKYHTVAYGLNAVCHWQIHGGWLCLWIPARGAHQVRAQTVPRQEVRTSRRDQGNCPQEKPHQLRGCVHHGPRAKDLPVQRQQLQQGDRNKSVASLIVVAFSLVEDLPTACCSLQLELENLQFVSLSDSLHWDLFIVLALLAAWNNIPLCVWASLRILENA